MKYVDQTVRFQEKKKHIIIFLTYSYKNTHAVYQMHFNKVEFFIIIIYIPGVE